MKRLVVLISGGGSNLQALINACENSEINGSILAVISNKSAVMGLQRAVKHGIDAITLNHQTFPSRESFDDELKQRIDSYQPDFVILAGFMRILTTEFVKHYHGRMINIHPSLLPKYPGLNTHQRAIENGDTQAGATVHFVTDELDGGPPVLQAAVPILPEDSATTLAKKVLSAEHVIYPTAIKWLCDERLTCADGQAYLDGKTLCQAIKLEDTDTY